MKPDLHGKILRALLAVPLFTGAFAATAADVFDGAVLAIPSVTVGQTTYTDVTVTVGNILSYEGSTTTPIVTSDDSYDSATGQLTIPSVKVGSTTYTNVVITVAGIKGVGGSLAIPLSLGVFVAGAPVYGLAYTTSSGYSGTTNAYGQFHFAVGDTVTFSAAGMMLGSTKPVIGSDGSATVTPLSLTGESAFSTPKATAITTLLTTLNTIGATQSGSNPNASVIPASSSLQTQLASQNTSAANLGTTQLQAAVDGVYGSGNFTATTTTNAQSTLQQAINSQSVSGTVWGGSCTCGGGATFYFQPDGTLNGMTDNGKILAGTWSGSTTSGGGVQLSLIGTEAYSKNGQIPANSTIGTADIMDAKDNSLQGVFTFTKVTTSSTITNTQYLGGWYGTYTPNAVGIAKGLSSGHAYIVLAPDGKLTGITDGAPAAITGTWNPATGIGNASFTAPEGAVTFQVNVATLTGQVAHNGETTGTISLGRTGSLQTTADDAGSGSGGSGSGSGGSSGSSGTTAAVQKILLLNVKVSWPANVGNVVSSFALGLTVRNASSNAIGSTVKSEGNPLGIGGIANSTSDNIAVSYPTGSTSTYSLSVGPSNCTISGGSGTVVDTNASNASAYSTVNVVCH